MQARKLIIFTDLDGTLLDHHSYTWQPARPALEKLQALNIPLVLCTSKTSSEVKELHRELALSTPYIVENGAGIIFPQPESSAHFFGKPYSELVDLLQQLRSTSGYRFKGFNDYSVAEVMMETGLTERSARLAKERLCSEPLRWDDSQEAFATFRQEIGAHDLQLLRGGRFFHVLSKEADKGTALRWLLDNYPETNETGWQSVALGDGPNDQSMLEAAELAVVIPSESGLSPKPNNPTVIYAQKPGPTGWNQTILEILK